MAPMSQKLSMLLLIALAACGPDGGGGDGSRSGLVVNEFVASNATGHADEAASHPDWIEIWNGGDRDVDLSGWTLTDNHSEPEKWAFPEGTTLEAGGFLVVFADGDTGDGPLHASFKLDADIGEDIGLFDAGGNPVDKL